MKFLPRIFDRINVLHVVFAPDGGTERALVPYSFQKGIPQAGEMKPLAEFAQEKDLLCKIPLVIAVSGKGVVTKDLSAGGIAETVTSDPETFIWTTAGNGISFVRRERLAAIVNELAETDASPLSIECLPDENPASLSGTAERFYRDGLTWKKVLKPSPEGSQLAMLLSKKLRLPVLGLLLVLLVVNFIAAPRVAEDFRSANAELASLRKSVSAATSGNDRRRNAVEQFSQKLPYRFSRLSDMIASVVPEKIVLNELAISPLTKTVEAGKPVQQNMRTIVLRGETSASESVTAFLESLGELGVGTVRLSSVEQDRERAVLTFRIDITL